MKPIMTMHSHVLKLVVVCLFLSLATFAAFWGVRNHEFVNYDDNVYITENSHVQTGITPESILWAFTSTRASNWHPLTWLTHILDCRLYGLKARGHHVTSVLLHVANTVLLLLVLKRMTGALWRSTFVAAMFALHPLHVESVAWVAERKDVLSTFFWMLTMWSYARYAERPAVKRYLLVLVSFVLGLMAKPMLVTLPFVLLLMDYWPLGRLQLRQMGEHSKLQAYGALIPRQGRSLALHLAWEKVPFFVLAGVSSVVTLFAQERGGAITSLELTPLKLRIANAVVSYASYIVKMMWPHRLAVFYPHPDMLPTWQVAGAGLLLVCVSLAVIRTARKRPYMAVGWLWYLGTLVPVIGIVQVGAQAMADRYTYVTLIGLFIMLAWGVADIFSRWHYKKMAFIISAGLVLAVFAICTSLQVKHWQNNMTLFKHALNVTSNNYLAHSNFGAALVGHGKPDKAIAHYEKALRIKPNYALAHYNLASALDRQGKLDQAIAHYAKSVRIKPDYFKAHSNLGVALARKGILDQAVAHFREALRVEPDLAEAHYNLGRTFALQGKVDLAIAHYKEVLRIRPNLAQAHYTLGVALAGQGKLDEGIGHLESAVRLKPNHQPYQRALDGLRRRHAMGQGITAPKPRRSPPSSK